MANYDCAISTESELRTIAKMRGDGTVEESLAWKAAEEIALLKSNVEGFASCNRARAAAEKECEHLRGLLETCMVRLGEFLGA